MNEKDSEKETCEAEDCCCEEQEKAQHNLEAAKKEKDRDKSSVLFCRLCAELFSVVALCNNLYSLVVTASLAYTVSKIYLAALRAGYEIGGCFKLPNAGASFHFSRMRNLFLRYCHC